jgi:hypothetical protein
MNMLPLTRLSQWTRQDHRYWVLVPSSVLSGTQFSGIAQGGSMDHTGCGSSKMREQGYWIGTAFLGCLPAEETHINIVFGVAK